MLKLENPNINTAKDGISVVICAWNEIDNLKELIPIILAQDYPLFEIVVVDDRSKDGTFDYLLEQSIYNSKIKFRHISQTPDHLSPKKYALTLGIRAAKYDILLLTDADCRPQSNQWIASMNEALSHDKSIVLGFSPYFKTKGFLNAFIRYETFITVLNYFSLAIIGKPYMGVGRNLMYRKDVFIQNKGFAKHTNVLGGDDDLFMNDVANTSNTTICLQPDSYVYSFPKLTWREWYRQKTRHLSVGKYYKLGNKIRLGIMAITQFAIWFLLPSLIVLYYTKPYFCIAIGLMFLLRLVAQWLVLNAINFRMKATVHPFYFPIGDFFMAVYYLIMGGRNIFAKKLKKW
ncbi:MAG: glycosyltransferase [Pseudarcicella sp.]|nr:glycosyltransferase [Pseudarcicella sp.]MBP6410027.1 glycosyltransferase [Pseudarcicella sp.]